LFDRRERQIFRLLTGSPPRPSTSALTQQKILEDVLAFAIRQWTTTSVAGDFAINGLRPGFVCNDLIHRAVKVTASDGESRVIGPGEILLVEDTSGKGHISRAVDGKFRHSVFVTLD